MDKSPEAFRTISEVAEALQTPAHVLRFWESRFPQIRPVKRAGGRRYYRPADVALLTGIKRLLHDEGLTIRGVQKILREQGVRHVAGMSGSADFMHEDDEDSALIAAMAAHPDEDADDDLAPRPGFLAVESAQVVALETALSRGERQIPSVPKVLSGAERAVPPQRPLSAMSAPLAGLAEIASALTSLPRPVPDHLRAAFAEQLERLTALRDQIDLRQQDAT